MKDNKNLIYVFVLILLGMLCIYIIPALKTTYFILTLVLFLFSKPKYDIVWVFFIVCLLDNPGNLFYQTTESLFKIGPLIFSYLHLFIVISSLKILFIKKHYAKFNVFYAKLSIPFFIWFVFLLLEGLYIGIEGGGKSGFRFLYNYLLVFITMPMFFIIPYFFNNFNKLIEYSKLLFIFVLINFVLQNINLVLGKDLHAMLGGGSTELLQMYSKDILRPVYFSFSSFFALMLSLYFIFIKNEYFKKKYLYIVFFVSFLSIIFTATRGWMLAIIFFVFALFIVNLFIKKRTKFASTILLGIILFLISLFFFPKISNQIQKSFDRFETITLITKGDLTAGGTNARLTDRLVPVKAKFELRPIVGWGFSNVGMKIHDNHVGNMSLLMFSGIIGYIIVIYFLIGIISKVLYLYFKIPRDNTYKLGLWIIIISLFSLFIIHSTSTQLFGYYIFVYQEGLRGFWVAIYLSVINLMYYKAKSSLFIEKTK